MLPNNKNGNDKENELDIVEEINLISDEEAPDHFNKIGENRTENHTLGEEVPLKDMNGNCKENEPHAVEQISLLIEEETPNNINKKGKELEAPRGRVSCDKRPIKNKNINDKENQPPVIEEISLLSDEETTNHSINKKQKKTLKIINFTSGQSRKGGENIRDSNTKKQGIRLEEGKV